VIDMRGVHADHCAGTRAWNGCSAQQVNGGLAMGASGRRLAAEPSDEWASRGQRPEPLKWAQLGSGTFEALGFARRAIRCSNAVASHG
ncbi:MAG TPA: hypothetical protein PK510_08730, partial [Ottowia sp.]|nr:hypothetical protein [Ottowia sp.]